MIWPKRILSFIPLAIFAASCAHVPEAAKGGSKTAQDKPAAKTAPPVDPRAQANTWRLLIERTCHQHVPSAVSQTDKQAVQEILKDFATGEQRRKNPRGYLSELDRVLDDVGFSELLDCRRSWQTEKNQAFLTRFLPASGPQEMHVGPSIDKNPQGEEVTTLVLNISLETPLTEALPSYMHESQHICQFAKDGFALNKHAVHLWNKLNPGEKWAYEEDVRGGHAPAGAVPSRTDHLRITENAAARRNRETFLREIEAYVLAMKGYTKLVSSAPDFCAIAPKGIHPDLADHYLSIAKNMDAGIYAQQIISVYLGVPGFKTATYGLFIPDSSEISYPNPANTPGEFRLKHLDPTFKREIEKLGLFVRED